MSLLTPCKGDFFRWFGLLAVVRVGTMYRNVYWFLILERSAFHCELFPAMVSFTVKVREEILQHSSNTISEGRLCCLFSYLLLSWVELLLLYFAFRSTIVLVLLVFCICFLVACIMYLHVTRVQVSDLRIFYHSFFYWLCFVCVLDYEAVNAHLIASESEICVPFKLIAK